MSRRRPSPVLTVVAVLTVVVGLVALALVASSGHGGRPTRAAGVTSTAATSAPAPTNLPDCAHPSALTPLLLSTTADGPAQDAITGQRVTTSFSLENGGFTAEPPPVSFVPATTAAQAGCQLATSYNADGWPAGPGRLALASVTIPALAGSAVPAYDHRVAWILVSAANEPAPAGCPTSQPSPKPSLTAPADPYEIFLMDATTGDPQIVYADSYLVCDGYYKVDVSLGFLYHLASVPWTLVSRSPDGSTVTISASWDSCQSFNGIVGPGGELKAAATEDNPTHIAIDVSGPTGPNCGPAAPHMITVGPAVAGRPLSAVLHHDPVGLLSD